MLVWRCWCGKKLVMVFEGPHYLVVGVGISLVDVRGR